MQREGEAAKEQEALGGGDEVMLTNEDLSLRSALARVRQTAANHRGRSTLCSGRPFFLACPVSPFVGEPPACLLLTRAYVGALCHASMSFSMR